MSDEVFGDDFDDEDDFEQRRSGGPNGKRILLLVLLALAILIGAAVAVFFFTDFGKRIGEMGGDSASVDFEKTEPDQRAATGGQTGPSAGEQSLFAPQFIPVPPLLVNLQSADSRRRNNFLKLEIWIEMTDGQQSRVESAMPKIVDTLQVYLRSLRVEELQGSAGIDRLRRDILIRTQKAAESFGARVNDILFKEILVQ